MKTTDAIFAVCEKRYMRLTENGTEESEAGKIVARYLQHLKETWKDSAYILNFINALQEAYTQKI